MLLVKLFFDSPLRLIQKFLHSDSFKSGYISKYAHSFFTGIPHTPRRNLTNNRIIAGSILLNRTLFFDALSPSSQYIEMPAINSG